MAYVFMDDLGQQAPVGTPEALMTRPEYDRLRELEAAGVAHDQAKQMIYDARKTGALPAVPVTGFLQLLAARPLLVAGLAAAGGLVFGAGLMLGIKRRGQEDTNAADRALRAALGVPDMSDMRTGVLTRN